MEPLTDYIIKRCRVCFTKNATLIITQEEEYLIRVISNCIEIFSDFEGKPNLPQGVCKGCRRKLNSVNLFIANAKESAAKFKECLDYERSRSYNSDINKSEELEQILNTKEGTLPIEDVFKENQELDILEDVSEADMSDEKPLKKRKSDNLFFSDLFKCNICEKVYKTQRTLARHHQLVHLKRNSSANTPYKCLQCEECCQNISQLNKHIQHVHRQDKVRELQCGVSGEELCRVIDTGGQHKLVECLVCGHLLTCKANFVTHLRRHTKERPYTCHTCHSGFTQRGSLNEHMRLQHMTLGRGKHVCHTCGKDFHKKSFLTSHLKVHTQDKTISCPYCPQMFKYSSDKSLHIRVHHTKQRPYVCKECGKKMASSCELTRHMYKHTQEKNFKCQECGVALKSRMSLRRHQLVRHSNEKRHVCECCGMRFSLRYNLTKHTEKRHSDKSGYCETCKKLVSNFIKHSKRHKQTK